MFTTTTAFVLSTIVSNALASSRGLLYMPQSSTPTDYQKFTTGALNWYYTYEALAKPELASSGMEFVPMLWGDKYGKKESFLGQVEALSNVKYALGMNEPDVITAYGGSDMSVSAAVALYKQYVTPLAAKGIKIGTPACSSSPTGTQWIKDFVAACSDCQISFVAMHYYGKSDYLVGHLANYHSMFPNMPLWVTEWADANAALSETETETQKIMDLMDSLSFVERYSYFGAFRSSQSNVGPNAALLDDSGNLNSLGKMYMAGSGSSTPATTSTPIYVAPSTTSPVYVAPASSAPVVVVPSYNANVVIASSSTPAAQLVYTATTMYTVTRPAGQGAYNPTSTKTSTKTKASTTKRHRHHHAKVTAAPQAVDVVTHVKYTTHTVNKTVWV